MDQYDKARWVARKECESITLSSGVSLLVTEGTNPRGWVPRRPSPTNSEVQSGKLNASTRPLTPCGISFSYPIYSSSGSQTFGQKHWFLDSRDVHSVEEDGTCFCTDVVTQKTATCLPHAVTRSHAKPHLPGHRNTSMPSKKILFLVLQSRLDQERGKWKN